jgi:lipopolysaccharide heptosyltransferase I
VSETSEVASPKKILIVRLGAMGDVIHAIPAAASLRIMFPDAQIGWVIENRWRELLGFRSLVDFVHVVDTRSWRKHPLKWATLLQIKKALKGMRAQKYDIAIDFQGAMKSSLMATLSGAAERYGFADPWEKPASLFYTHPARVKGNHVVERNIELVLTLAGKYPRDLEISGWTPVLTHEELHGWAESRIRDLGLAPPFAILNPGAGWGAKQWPTERYTEVARLLGDQGIRSLVNYGPGEEKLAQQIERSSGRHAVASTFTISQLMAITREAALFVGGDTGPLHLAAFLKIPVVAIFGPTDPTRTGPYGTRSIVLRDSSSTTSHKRYRETEAGLLNITTAQVLNAALELLGKSGKEARA